MSIEEKAIAILGHKLDSWVNYVPDAAYIKDLEKYNNSQLDDRIQIKDREILALNPHFFEYMTESKKKALSVKIISTLLAIYTRGKEKSYPLEQYHFFLNKLTNRGEEKNDNFIIEQQINWMEEYTPNPLTINQLIKDIDPRVLQDLVKHDAVEIKALNPHFFNLMEEEKKKELRVKIYNLLLAIHAQNAREIFHKTLDTDLEKRCRYLLASLEDSNNLKASQSFITKPVRSRLYKIIHSVLDLSPHPARQLYKAAKGLEKGIDFIHNERINFSIDETTPITAAQGIIAATGYNPLGYSTGLAKQNLDAIGQVTGQISWIAPTAILFLEVFQLCLEANHFHDLKEAEEQWFKLFWASLPEATQQKLLSDIAWTLANTTGFWLGYRLGGDTVLSGMFTVSGLGLVFSMSAMVLDLGLQLNQLVGLQQKINEKESEFQNLLENRAENKLSSREIKLLRQELTELELERKKLIAQITIHTAARLVGMLLMSLGPLAPILPAIGSIVSSAGILLFAVAQQSFKIHSVWSYRNFLEEELVKLKDSFSTCPDETQQRLLFLEILEVENDIAQQNHLIKMNWMILVRNVLVKLAMETIIFFAISFSPLYLAVLSTALGLLEAKLMQWITDFLALEVEPMPPHNIPQLNGGYSLCNSKDEVKDKKIFIEVNGINIVVYYMSGQEQCTYEINKKWATKQYPSLALIDNDNISGHFTEILAILTNERITPKAAQFEESFQTKKKELMAEKRKTASDDEGRSDSRPFLIR